MKKIISKIIIVFLAFLISIGTIALLFLDFEEITAEQYVKVHFIDPTTIEVKNMHSESFSSIQPKSQLFEGDTIRTTGLSEIHFPAGNMIRLDGNSEIILHEIGEKNAITVVELVSGNTWIKSINNPIEVNGGQTTTSLENATASFAYDEKKLDIAMIQHASSLAILDSQNESIWNVLYLPIRSQATVFSKSINENYKQLSSKKLKKQLKLRPIKNRDMKKNEWISTNLTLDATVSFEHFQEDSSLIIPGDIWYLSKTTLEKIHNMLVFVASKKEESLEENVNNRLTETQNLILSYGSEDLIETSIDSYADTWKAYKKTHKKEAEKLLIEHYRMYDHISATSPFHPILLKINELREDSLSQLSEKSKYNLYLSFKYTNDLQDIYEAFTLDEDRAKKIASLLTKSIKKINAKHHSYEEIDNLRNNYYYFLLAHIDYANENLLEVNSVLENKHIELAEINDKKIAQDLRYEILENQLILTDQIIEETKDFELASLYLQNEETLDDIERIPDEFAFKKHLKEFAWIIAEKITNNIHSDTTVAGKDFVDYLKIQKKISNLSGELEDDSDSLFSGIGHAVSEKNMDDLINIQKLMQTFLDINVSFTEQDIELLSESGDKISIYNLEYNDRLIPKIKYNISTGKIFEVTLEDDQVVNVTFDKTSFAEFLDQKEASNGGIISGSIDDNRPIEKKEPENEITKLVKEIIKRELSQENVEIHLEDITLLDPDGEEAEISRARIFQTEIIFDFTYQREYKLAKEVTVLAKQQYTFEKPIPLNTLPKIVEDKYMEIEKIESIKDDFMKMLANYQISIEKKNIMVDELAQDTIEFKSALSRTYDFKLTGLFNITQELFTSIKIGVDTYENITFEEVFSQMQIAFIEELLDDNKVGIQADTFEIVSSVVNPDRILIKDAEIAEHKVRFILDIQKTTALNILIDNEVDLNIPETPLEDVVEVVSEKIAEILKQQQEEEAAKALENEELHEGAPPEPNTTGPLEENLMPPAEETTNTTEEIAPSSEAENPPPPPPPAEEEAPPSENTSPAPENEENAPPEEVLDPPVGEIHESPESTQGPTGGVHALFPEDEVYYEIGEPLNFDEIEIPEDDEPSSFFLFSY